MVDVDEELVRRLLAAQHPDLAELEVVASGRGWDNAVFRLGPHLAARLPIRQAGADLVAAEVRFLPELATRLPLPIAAPIRTGAPALGYSWPWTIVPWFAGELAFDGRCDLRKAARDLGAVLRAFAVPAPASAPTNAYRGVPLAARDALTRDRIERLDLGSERGAVIRAWDRALAAATFVGEPVWVHGDLHPANIVVRDATVAAIIDFGDLNAGDPAADLAVAWMWFDADARPIFRAACGVADNATWIRAWGNALAHALACLTGPPDDRRVIAMGRRTLAEVLRHPP